MPIGLLMVSRGELTFQQLRQALHAQSAAAHGRLGEWLQQLRFSTEEQVTAALSVQWACPTLRIMPDAQASCATLLPRTLQEAYFMLPVHFTAHGPLLYVGFADRIAHRLLYAVEQMLGCRTVSCLVARSALKDAWERIPPAPYWPEAAFEPGSASESARIIASYAQRCGAQEIRITSCGEYIWARLRYGVGHFDLLFRTP
jgi:hypothetical protein